MNISLKRNYFSSKISENEGSVKETWKVVNKLFNYRSKTTKIASLRVDGQSITDIRRISDTMNRFFCTIGKNLSEKILNYTNPLIDGWFSTNITY